MNESYIGKRIQRPDIIAKVTGEALYTGDIAARRGDLLRAKALYPPYAHAKILAIDTSEAEKLPGVAAVLTAANLPARSSNRFGVVTHDKPALAEDKVIYEGDAVAAVAAESLEIAEKALSLIKVEYEPLEVYEDYVALADTEVSAIHCDHPWSQNSPVSSKNQVVHGDIEEAFGKADVVIDQWYETPMVDHAYLEPDVCIAEPDFVQGGIVIHSPQHAIQHAKRDLCGVFGLPQNKVRIISTVVGGGFGGKEDSTYDVSAIAGLLCIKTGRPVAFEFTREEVFKNTGKRHPSKVHHRLAASKDGKLLGIKVDDFIDKGAYQSVDFIPDRMTFYAGGPYKIPATDCHGRSIFTNHPYGCAFRGLGVPQAHFAMEGQMDMLADKLGMDPLELRLKNIVHGGDQTHSTQSILEERGVGLEECLLKAAEAIQWDKKVGGTENGTKRRGKGISCFIYGTGTGGAPDGAHCVVQAQLDGSFNIMISQSELGQGLIVAMTQIAAETLGIRPQDVYIDLSDSAASLDAGPTVSSRSTVFAGNAVMDGCNILRDRFLSYAAEHIYFTGKDNLDIKDGKVIRKGHPDKDLPLSQVINKAYVDQVPLAAIGSWYPPKVVERPDGTHEQMHAFTFGACAVELDVDVATGEIDILRCVLACDVGRAINPDTLEGQMEGGLAQGIGWSLMEEHFMDKGRMKNYTYHDFLIPTSMDLPRFETIIVEHPNCLGPYGAKGIGEPPVVGAAPAIRSAIHDATGIFMNTIPFTPVRVMEALRKAENRGK